MNCKLLILFLLIFCAMCYFLVRTRKLCRNQCDVIILFITARFTHRRWGRLRWHLYLMKIELNSRARKSVGLTTPRAPPSYNVHFWSNFHEIVISRAKTKTSDFFYFSPVVDGSKKLYAKKIITIGRVQR